MSGKILEVVNYFKYYGSHFSMNRRKQGNAEDKVGEGLKSSMQ